MTRIALGWLHTEHGQRWRRYATVSIVSVASGQAALALSFGVLGLSARSSNYLAFVAGAVPSYWLNRRWTWGKTGRSHLLGELVPFWALAVAGLALSTWAVEAAEVTASGLTQARETQTLLVMTASLAAYGGLWVLKFLVLDRFLFSPVDPSVHAPQWLGVTSEHVFERTHPPATEKADDLS